MPINCVNCSSGIGGRRHRECDCCKRKIHIDCTDLQQVDDRLTRAKLKCIKIVCNACSDNIEHFADMKSTIDAMRADVNLQLTRFDEKLAMLEIKLSAIDTSTTTTAADASFREITIREAADRINRSKNIIVRNVPEHTGPVAERKEHDAAKVSEILDTVGSTSSAVSIARLGKPRTDSKPRALRVVLPDSYAAKFILRNKNKLLDSASLKGLRICDDKTKMEIDFLEELRTDLKRRQDAGERDLTIKYYRGVPEITKLAPKK